MAASPGGRFQSPDILLIQADQLAPHFLPAYGHPVTLAPNLSELARGGAVFDSAYCNSPLCAPSRYSMLTGRMPSDIGAHDNASALSPAVPTFAHHLRVRGYRTVLSGKMHFCGPTSYTASRNASSPTSTPPISVGHPTGANPTVIRSSHTCATRRAA